jgi:hypothetical protein
MNRWTRQVEAAIIDTCIKIIKEPLIYFSEADIQQLLCENLRRISTFNKLYKTSLNRGKDSSSHFKTSAIHREYGGGAGRRIDIVVFHPKELRNINYPNLTNGNKYLEPLFAFELGSEKTSDALTHFSNDLKKLSKAKEAGYLIHIYKDITQSRKGTKSRENTEIKIQRTFRDVFDKNIKVNSNIKVLAILIRTYVNQKRIIGKCEIFDKHDVKWDKVNISNDSDLKKKILRQIK